MTGAAAALSGFDGLGVLIHGSSGCYYYPSSLLHADLHGTCITGEEVIFGAEERLRAVVEEMSRQYAKVAVVTTCVPSLTGEDVREILADWDVIVVEAPGFAGDFEAGYAAGLGSLEPAVDEAAPGINIAGLSGNDPFSAGNQVEALRLLSIAGIPPGVRICSDRLDRLKSLHPWTVSVNPDLAPGPGRDLGSLLGIGPAVRAAFSACDSCGWGDAGPLEREAEAATARISRASDAFLRHYDPPTAVISGGASYAAFAAGLLRRYLDADIRMVCSRNGPVAGPFPSVVSCDLDIIADHIRYASPDLIVGSSIEHKILPDAAFAGITPPLRGQVRIFPRPLAGIAGTLSFMEEVLNACTDRNRRQVKIS